MINLIKALKKVKIWNGVNTVDINDSGQMHVVLRGEVDDSNSSSTPLGVDEVFTGSATDVLDYAIIFVTTYSDVASATDGLHVEVSSDGIVWREASADKFTIAADTEKTFSFQPNKKYFRVHYTNGGTEQTTFDLQTVLKKTNSKPSSHRISDSISGEDDATLQKSVLTGENPSGNFINFSATNGGNFKVSIEEFDGAVATDTNKLNTVSFMHNEDGGQDQVLGDTIFRGAAISISPEHHEIHCGDSYEATHIDSIGNGATIDFLIIVPNEAGTYPDQTQRLYHFLYEVSVESECNILMYEGATVSANGTAISSFNRNRNSTLTDTLGIYHSPTVTTTGTQIEIHKAGSGKATGGTVDRGQEWVLGNNTTYLIRVTNQTTSTTYVDFNANYYVHPGV